MSAERSIPSLPPEVIDSLALLPADERRGYVEAWELAELPAPAVPPARRAAMWSAIRARIAPLRVDRPAEAPARIPRVFDGIFARQMALACAIIVFTLAGLWRHPTDVTLVAPTGGAVATNATLPDGSTVVLSPGSRIRHAGTGFGVDNRALQLHGEAFFDVVRSGQPFEVATFNARVQVLGTAFNVRSWPSDVARDTRVFVERGQVQVSAGNLSELAVVLHPGEATEVAMTALPTPAAPADAEFALAWRSGDLAFSNAAIGSVLDEIARRFDLRLDAEESIRDLRISYWKHDPAGAEELLADVTDAAALRFRRISGGFEVYLP